MAKIWHWSMSKLSTRTTSVARPTMPESILRLPGPAIWRGGYNSGKINSTNNLYLNTECGINRIAVRSKMQPGKVTITAREKGWNQRF